MTWARVAVTTGMDTFFFIYIIFFLHQIVFEYFFYMPDPMLGTQIKLIMKWSISSSGYYSKKLETCMRFSGVRHSGGA